MIEEFTRRRNFPYLHGVLLATNAIRDARLLVDGPNCSFFKSEHVFGAHDIESTLLDVSGQHRVAHTDLHPNLMVTEHDRRFVEVLGHVAGTKGAGVVMVATMPMVSVTGVDLEALADQVSPAEGGIVILPARSLERCWLDGYADTLRRLAECIDLPAATPDPGRVALIGYLMDRNEGDHRGNLKEMRRLAESLGLQVSTVWLDGGPYADLRRVAEAGTLIALPHGRAAAEVLASRTGALVVQAGLPFGLDASDRFLHAMAVPSGRTDLAASVAADERSRIVRSWEWLVPRRFMFRKLGFAGDPHMMAGFCDLATLLGAEVPVLVAYARRPQDWESAWSFLPTAPLWEPRIGEISNQDLARDLDLMVANSDLLDDLGGHGLEFGFPSRRVHHSADAAYLGYNGALAFVDSLSNTLGDRSARR